MKKTFLLIVAIITLTCFSVTSFAEGGGACYVRYDTGLRLCYKTSYQECFGKLRYDRELTVRWAMDQECKENMWAILFPNDY